MTEDRIKEIHEADIRNQCRKYHKKAGETILADHSTSPLMISSQWEGRNIKLQSAIGSIVGAKGILISYVDRDNKFPDLAGPHNTWGEKAAEVPEPKGLEYKLDN